VCQPTTLTDGRAATWCYANKPFKVGARTADIDLYFLGSEPTAPLIEIQIHVRGCNEDELTGWLRTNFGGQIDQRPKRGYWQNPHMWIGALLPSDPGLCVVHMLPLSEQAEIARIKAQ